MHVRFFTHSVAAKNLVLESSPFATFAETSSLLECATTVSIENERSASLTLIVPCADERRPEKGTTSGERPHCALMLIRPTTEESVSTSGAADAVLVVKIAAWGGRTRRPSEESKNQRKESGAVSRLPSFVKRGKGERPGREARERGKGERDGGRGRGERAGGRGQGGEGRGRGKGGEGRER